MKRKILSNPNVSPKKRKLVKKIIKDYRLMKHLIHKQNRELEGMSG